MTAKDMLCAAVIPARGGSKRIPRKNIRPFLGRPMMGHAIEAARESGCFSKIIVSTDDLEIAKTAEAQGAEVPFMRPADLADDFTGTDAVIRHAILELNNTGFVPEYVCCIYATSPFIRAADIRSAFDLLQKAPSKDFAFAVTTFEYPIHRALCFDENGDLEMLFPEHRLSRSQDLPKMFHDAGMFYWGRSAAFVKGIPVFSKQSIPFELPRYRVQDIDDEDDWKRAEWMARALLVDPRDNSRTAK